MGGSLRKGRGPVAAWLLQLFAAMLLLCSGGAFAQSATTMTVTGSSPATFSAAGQTLTIQMTLWTGNTPINGVSFSSGSPDPITSVTCPGGDLQTSVTCSFTYTTTDMDVALGRVMVLGRWVATRPSGGNRSSTTNTFYIPLQAAPALTANPVGATVAYGSSNNPITLNITGGTATSVAVASQGSHGIATASGTSITYTPNAGYAGADSFTYTATDASGTSSPATVSITVSAVLPDAPTIGTATAGDAQATVAFTAPASNGGAAITQYTVTSSPGGVTATCASSPCTVTGLTNGTAYTFTVTATNSIGAGPASAASNSVTPKATQTITFANPGSQNYGTTPTLTATASSGLPVTFSSSTTAVCTITSGGALTFVTAGACTINANQAGNGAYQPAPQVTQSFMVSSVVPGAPTIGTATAGNGQATVSFTPPASNGGATIIQYTVTSSPGGLTGTCASSPCTVTGLANGTAYTFTVVATNAAGTGSPSAASNSVTPTGSQTITFTNPGSQNYGTMPTLTATASSGLPVTFSSSTTAVCAITSGGILTFVSGGTCTINANQAGNGAYLPAPQVSQSFMVNMVVPTAHPVSATVAYGSAVNPVTLNITGGTAVSVAISSAPSHGTATATGTSITYTPAMGYSGPDSFTYTATNAAGTSAPATVTITVLPPTVTYTPANPPAAIAGAAYSHSLASANGGAAPYTYVVASGALPSGLTLAPNGTLSGTPTASGTFSFTVRATDASTGTGPFSATSAMLTLTVNAPMIVISPFSLPSGMVATAYSTNFSASGGSAPYTFAVTSGALPVGMTLNATGVLSGTPTAAGTFNFLVTATDAYGFTATQAYALPVTPPVLAMAPSAIANATAETAYSQTFTASGGTAPYIYSIVSGTLPAGLTLSASGTVSGTPTVAGAFNFTVRVTDSSTGTGAPFTVSHPYTLMVAAPTITLTPATVPGATVGVAYSQTMAAAGGNGGYTWSLTAGALPPGVSLSSAGVLSGTPTAPGNYNFTAEATDGFGFSGSQAYAVVVVAPTITLTPATLPAATVATPYSQSMTANGGTGPYTYSLAAGSLPTGMSLGSAGTLSGTPTSAGTFNFTVKATDAYGSSGSIAVSIPVGAAAQAITNFKANPTSPTYAPNGTFAISATGGASTSPVVFASTTTSVCTVSGSTVTMLAAGACALTANQAADANYLAAPQVALNVTIAAATQAITNFKANPTSPTYAPNGTFAISATGGASTSPVVFASTTTSVCTVSGSTVTMLAAGACALTANQAADANYLAAPQVALNVTIAAAAPVIGWVGVIHKTQGEAAFDLPLPTSNSTGAFTFTSSNASVATVSGRTVTIVGGGTATLTATQAATANYTAGSVTATLTVDMRPDPTKDPSVAAGLQAQVDASLRFASAQEDNVRDRMRQLRNEKGTPAHNGLTMSIGGRGGMGMSLPVGLGAAGGAGANGINGGWMGGSIVYGQRSGMPGREGYDLRSDGISFGIDHAFGDYVFGAALGSGWGNTDFDDGRSKQDAKHRAFTLYGLWRGNEHWYAEGLMGLGQLDFDLQRWSTVANALASARRKGDQQYGSFSVGYTQRNDSYELTGYGRVEGNRTTLDAYRENGLGIYDLTYRRQRIETSLAAVGVEGSYHGKLGRHAIRPFWSLEYRDALGDSGNAAINYAVQPSTGDYLLALHGYADRMWALGGGFDLELARGWQMSFQYRREESNGLRNNVFGLRVVFGQGGGTPALMLTPAQYKGVAIQPQPQQQP